MSYYGRLLGAMVLLTTVTAALVGFFTYRDLESKLIPLGLEALETDAGSTAAKLDAYVADARADALALRGAAAVNAIVRANAAGGTDPETGLTQEEWEENLDSLFRAMLDAKRGYVKIRFIGVADGGREIVRVDRMGPQAEVRSVGQTDLQPKADRFFMTETIKLPAGGVYVSPIDLNQEYGRIAEPHMPVLRTATPVHAADGAVFGIIIINVDMRPVFETLRSLLRPVSRLYVLNEAGQFLLHPDPDREFGFEFGDTRGISSEIAGLKVGDPTSRTGLFAIGDDWFGVAAVPVRMAGGPMLTVVQAVPYSVMIAPAAAIRDSSLVAGLAGLLLAAILAIALARSLSRPIRRMTAAVDDLTAGRDASLPVESPDEMGVLARAFQHYATRERMFSAALLSSEDAVIATDPEGVITGWNPAAERLYGYSAKEAIGQHASMLLDEGHAVDVRSRLASLEEGHGFQEVEVVHRTRHGDPLPLEARASAVRGPDGNMIGALAILSDVTEKRDLEEKFRLAFEASPSGMVLVDRKGEITLSNAEMAMIFGYPQADLLGMHVSRLLPANSLRDRELILRAFASAPVARSMGQWRSLEGLRADGKVFPIEVELQPIRTAREDLVLAVVVDVSERRKAEALIARKTEELERSNAELEQFAYVASHDLREPLRMVASYTELLAERYRGQLDERADKYIGYIVDGARRMQQLVADLLALSRVGTQGKPLEPVDASRVVGNVLRSMHGVISDTGAEVDAQALPIVKADEIQLGQLFQNLVANAIKFRAPERQPRIAIRAHRRNNWWEFSVADNGIGIESEYAERIFQMFQRLHGRGQYEGNGIGLAIAKKIVERHGGRIWFESKPGEGTVFRFTLPGLATRRSNTEAHDDGEAA